MNPSIRQLERMSSSTQPSKSTMPMPTNGTTCFELIAPRPLNKVAVNWRRKLNSSTAERPFLVASLPHYWNIGFIVNKVSRINL